MNRKDKYYKFAQENNLPLYHQPWWLDTVANNWDVALAEKKGSILAAWPFTINKKLGFSFSTMPPLTQRLGPFIVYPPNQKYERKLALEKEAVFELFAQMPQFDFFSQNLHYAFSNILPFHWKGFGTKVKITYLLFPSDFEQLFSQLRSNIRSKIKKATKKGIIVEQSSDVQTIINFTLEAYQRKNTDFPFDPQLIAQLDKQLSARNQRTIYIAKLNNATIAAIFMAYDKTTCYYLFSGFDPKYQNLGAVNLLIWTAITECLKHKLIFDFEGSMNEDIENFFRGFGAHQQPFYNIYKFRKKIHCLLNCLKPVI